MFDKRLKLIAYGHKIGRFDLTWTSKPSKFSYAFTGLEGQK